MGETIEKKQGIIFGGGEVLNYKVVRSLITDETMVVCADSGYNHCKRIGVHPDLLVGDFDSLKDIPDNVVKVPLPAEKNYTDTTLAIECAIHKGCNQLILTGMLGGRLDHTLSNIQSLIYCTNENVNTFITDGATQIFCLVAKKDEPKKVTISPLENYYFSLFAFSEKCKGVTIQGAKYLLDNHTLSYDLSRAVSNEFIGEDVTISLEEGTLLLLLVPKDN